MNELSRYISLPLRKGAQLLLAALLCGGLCASAESKKPAPSPENDVLVLANGDTLHGMLVSEAGGKVTFRTNVLGDVVVGWDNIKELHAGEIFAVLDKTAKTHGT